MPWFSNVVNEYWINGKIEWYCGSKFSYHCQISPKYHHINDFKVLTRFSEISCFSFTKIFIFLKSTCLLLAILLKFIFNQKEKRGFIWSKTFDFLFQKPSNIYSEKKSCSLKVAAFYFLGTPIKWSGFEWLLPFISIERLHKNVKILHSKLI